MHKGTLLGSVILAFVVSVAVVRFSNTATAGGFFSKLTGKG